jgi:mannose-6-phosphate isomerase-like protein (cupin superfamily)
MPKSGKLFNADKGRCQMKEIFNGPEAHLEFLSAADLTLSSTVSPHYSFPNEEVLIFNLGEAVSCRVEGTDYPMEHFDVLYVPLGTGFQVTHQGEGEGHLYVYRATGDEVYPVFHSRFEDAKKNVERIRHLNRKVVYKMFDVSEGANKFMAGYTFYEDHTRAWPPHNHTDQEEVYSFIEGDGGDVCLRRRRASDICHIRRSGRPCHDSRSSTITRYSAMRTRSASSGALPGNDIGSEIRIRIL